jgi:hypothetical protein
MSTRWTQPTESETKRNIFKCPEVGGGEARAVTMPFRPLLELQPLYFGGEVTAG